MTWCAHLAVAQVEIIHGVGEQDAAQGLLVGVALPRKEGVRLVRPAHILVHPAPAFPPLAKPAAKAVNSSLVRW